MGRRGDSGRTVHLGARVFTADRLGEPGVQTHPYRRPGLGSRPGVIGQSELRGHARGNAGRGIGEDDEDRVALGEQRDAAMVGERAQNNTAVFNQHLPICRPEQPGEAG